MLFLAGGLALVGGYVAFLALRYRRLKEWQHGRFQFRFSVAMFVYIVLFWTVIGLFTDVRSELEFAARHEPYFAADGLQHGYTFLYVDHPGSYERVNSAALNDYIRRVRPERVQLKLETIKDFGKLRAYSVEQVDGIRVNVGWIGGQPPWTQLRH